MTIEELIERSHAMAISKGWWPNGVEGRSVVDQVNNFHAEISEAWEEYRRGRMELWWSLKSKAGCGSVVFGMTKSQQEASDLSDADMLQENNKPEGFWIEIADLCIRLADTMGAYGWRSTDVTFVANPTKADAVPRFIATLHVCISDMYDNASAAWTENAQGVICETLAVCRAFAEINGVDLLALCELKMAYNATRSHRHGGKRA